MPSPCFAFGFGTQIVTLDALRFVQGMACGFIWGGGLAWVISVAPRERRGEIIGTVFAGAIFGTLLGPVLGTLAVAGGTELVFSLVATASVALAVWSARFPDPPAVEATTGTPLKALVTNRRMMLGAWLILLEACTVGATGTLLPLRLSRFGASGVAIGVVFLLTALISTFLATPFGRVVDRRGSGVLLTFGLTTTAVLLAILPIPQSVVVLAIVCVIALGGPLTAYAIPAMTIITDAAERAGIPVVVATTPAQPGLGDRGDDRRPGRRQHLAGHQRRRAAAAAGRADGGHAGAGAARAPGTAPTPDRRPTTTLPDRTPSRSPWPADERQAASAGADRRRPGDAPKPRRLHLASDRAGPRPPAHRGPARLPRGPCPRWGRRDLRRGHRR